MIEFFRKVIYLDAITSNSQYAFIPHRCEEIKGKGDVILSGDPDGGRPDLFWDTGETIEIPWPLGRKKFIEQLILILVAISEQYKAKFVRKYWEKRNWVAEFELSGPLEQAGSGLLLPTMKIMKPRPENYRFFMVHHQDELWRRHPFEELLGKQ